MFIGGKEYNTGFTNDLYILNSGDYRQDSYSHNCQIAEYIVRQLNGMVNKVVMAENVTFMANTGLYGSSIFNTISLNIHGIMTCAKTVEELDSRVFYTIIHELLHVDQDLSTFFKMQLDGIISREECTFLVEVSCHAMTMRYIEYLKNVFCWLDLDMKVCKKYAMDAIDFQYKKLDYKAKTRVRDIDQYANSYYRWRTPLDAMLFIINDQMLFSYSKDPDSEYRGKFITDLIVEAHIEKLYIIVYKNNVRLNFELVYFNGNWINPYRIANVLKVFSLFEDGAVVGSTRYFAPIKQLLNTYDDGVTDNDWALILKIDSVFPDMQVAYHV